MHLRLHDVDFVYFTPGIGLLQIMDMMSASQWIIYQNIL